MSSSGTSPQPTAEQPAPPDDEPDLMAERSTGEQRTSSVQRAFEVIRVLRRASSALTLTSIAETVGIAPSTAHSILNDLLSQAAVQQDENKRYRLGPAVFYLGSAYGRSAPAYRSTWVELVMLANELGVTASVAVPWDRHHLILGSHQGGGFGVEMAVGGLVPLDGGSWGKAYHAWSDEPVPTSLGSYTAQTVTDPAAYAEEIDRTRSQGYATDRSEFSEGVAAVAVGVTSGRGYEGLVSLLAPIGPMEPMLDQVGGRLASLASRASLALGDLDRTSSIGVF